MYRVVLLTLLFTYYTVWLVLPAFDAKWIQWAFPWPSEWAIMIPIVLLLIGFGIVGTFGGILLIRKPASKRMH